MTTQQGRPGEPGLRAYGLSCEVLQSVERTQGALVFAEFEERVAQNLPSRALRRTQLREPCGVVARSGEHAARTRSVRVRQDHHSSAPGQNGKRGTGGALGQREILSTARLALPLKVVSRQLGVGNEVVRILSDFLQETESWL